MYDWDKMKNIIILIPVYNDWESLKKLILEINNCIENIDGFVFNCLIVNDASTVENFDLNKKNSNFKSIKILSMNENRGHARCNAFGIRYVCKNENFDYLILMDGDGEDRPEEIKSFINKIKKEPDKSVVAKRVKRSEGPFFQFLYQMHKLMTLVFTGNNIKFGNYSCLTKNDVKILSDKASLWSSFSGTVKKNLKNLNEINSSRGVRYFGPSKMSIFNLLIHSFSIIAVFKYNVFLRSLFIVLLLYFLGNSLSVFSFFSQILIIIFNIIILLVSFREKKDDLINSQDNLKSTKDITH